MIVKVCGMRDADNIRAVEAAGIDWMGFIFYPKSKRYVSAVPAYLPERARRIGVFVQPDVSEVLDKVETFGLGGVQLHGHETPAFCRRLRRLLEERYPRKEILLIKAFGIASAEDLSATGLYGMCHYFLFDTSAAGYGGSGRTFDWKVLDAYAAEVPFLLSGGIGPDHLSQLRAFRHPLWQGVDLNSRFEEAPALKEVGKLRRFLSDFLPGDGEALAPERQEQ